MEDDISRELQLKNQEMLLNKKKIDLDTSMESLLVFYSNYSNTIASEINNRICVLRNINSDSDQSKIIYNTITSFFFLTSKKLKEILNKSIEPIKNRLDNIDDNVYSKELEHASVIITNQMLDYYVENMNMLSNEINQDIDAELKDKINSYLFEVLTVRMINMLKDKFMYSIKVITNNFEENKEIIESINEKTIK